jgi:hypothetical protein
MIRTQKLPTVNSHRQTAYPDGIHALDPSDSQSSPPLRGIIGIPDGCTKSTTIGVDLVEAEPSPPPGGVVGAGAARGWTTP